MQTLILCGGKGTRIHPFTEYLPKPMIPLNGQPILAQVMRTYADQGYTEFLLSLGYKKEIIIDYFDGRFPDWNIEFADTGESDTGDRIWKCRDLIKGTFFATYTDGLANIDLNNLLDFHRSHKGLATVTSVPLPSQYGTLTFDEENRVLDFKEKPVIREYWINAGFFVFDKEIFEYWQGENLEKEVLPHLANLKLLYIYKHTEFWKSMDTYKDHQELDRLYKEGNYPWKV